MTIRILIVDDEPRIRTSLEGLLRDEGYDVTVCGSGEEGLRLLGERQFEAMLLDVVLPGMDGLQTLEEVHDRFPNTKVFMMSGRADLEMAVRATKLGAQNFFEKPLNPDSVLLSLKNVAHQTVLERRVDSLKQLVDDEDEMVGTSSQMRMLKQSIAKAAPTDGRVLIFGENGTGKELVARAIHRQSHRRDFPFISLNCAALPRDLVESELFGYEKGAFTGAVRRKPGRIQLADGGTLFLDEIGDMDLNTQAKLLRVLEEHQAVRLGGTSPYTFDVRIISATNKNLNAAIQNGTFREDLFYRLNVIPMNVPPLQERPSDIPMLAEHFLRFFCSRTGRGVKHWGAGAVERLSEFQWPGNVRELKNCVERLVIMSEGAEISANDVVSVLPHDPAGQDKSVRHYVNEEGLTFRQIMERFEKKVLEEGFRNADGNVSEMARRLKIDRANLSRKLKTYGIQKGVAE